MDSYISKDLLRARCFNILLAGCAGYFVYKYLDIRNKANKLYDEATNLQDDYEKLINTYENLAEKNDILIDKMAERIKELEGKRKDEKENKKAKP